MPNFIEALLNEVTPSGLYYQSPFNEGKGCVTCNQPVMENSGRCTAVACTHLYVIAVLSRFFLTGKFRVITDLLISERYG